MAKAATGSFDAVVRTTASKAAVEGVCGASRHGEGLEELRMRFGRPELVGEVRLHELAGVPRRERAGDSRQRHRELALNVTVLLRVGGQLTFGEGAGFPATVERVAQQVTPDNRLRKHLVHR
jgi:hypothetical protein